MVERVPLSKRLPVLCRDLAGALQSPQSLEGPWTSEQECLLAVVNQAIECRSAGDPATSLLMLEWLRDQGIEHPHVLFNRIAALIDLDRYTEALFCLPALAALDQANVLKAASDALQIHIDTLLTNMRGHCHAQLLQPVALELLETVPVAELYERLFSFAHQQIPVGGVALAKVVLEELTQWGEWCIDDLPIDLQREWAALVVELGATLWQDLTSYRAALQLLEDFPSPNQRWEYLEVQLTLHQDLGLREEAVDLALEFLFKHPGHPEALAWLASQQTAQLKSGLPGASADRVLAVDQALARDALILDSLRKQAGSLGRIALS